MDVDLEDVKTILQTYKGATLYPITISNIIKDIRLKTQERIDQGDLGR